MTDVMNYELTKNKNDNSYVGKQKNGFYPYDYEEYHLFMEYKWQDTMLLESRKIYENDKGKRDSLMASVASSFEKYKPSDHNTTTIVK